MSGPVPVTASLADIYPPADLAAQSDRWARLRSHFARAFGADPSFVARSPGRVNLIGEHIDYSLYPVLPMAITADCLVAVAVSSSSSSSSSSDESSSVRIRIRNVHEAKFAPREFDVPLDGAVDIDAAQFEWTNYFKCGLRGALELLRRKRGAAFRPAGMDLLVDGSVPVGGGLSSSAAVVSASALAVMVANGELPVDKTELTELAIVSERAVGVNSGGMDQAASVFSRQGFATLVSFAPELAALPVKLPSSPPELCFLVAQSFVTSNKHVTAPIHYNLRVLEVSLAAAYLHAVLNPPGAPLPADPAPLGISLHGFHRAYFQHHDARGSLDEEAQLLAMLELTRATLTQEEGYTRQQIAQVLGPAAAADLERRIPVRADRFKLRQRALHVFGEALRVRRFLALLDQNSSSSSSSSNSDAGVGEALGALMNQTQDSCRDLYECSCPEMDELCRIARAAGAYSARLTGAGWGGCSVHLVPADRVAAVRGALESQYYARLELTDEQRAQAVVVSRPGSGSVVYRA